MDARFDIYDTIYTYDSRTQGEEGRWRYEEVARCMDNYESFGACMYRLLRKLGRYMLLGVLVLLYLPIIAIFYTLFLAAQGMVLAGKWLLRLSNGWYSFWSGLIHSIKA